MADESTKNDLATVGLKLMDVVPIIFPEHIMIRKVKKEYDDLYEQFMARFWRDNGPWALLRVMKLCNACTCACTCPNCVLSKRVVSISCSLWGRMLNCMKNCGITYCVLSVCVFDVNTVGAYGTSSIASFEEFSVPTTYPREEGFNSLTACKYMAPVSHIDAHIVFQRAGNVIGIVYGRKLWEAKSISSPEIRKLDMLFASLNVLA